MLHGQRRGAPGSPTAFKTSLSWVLAGSSRQDTTYSHATVLQTSILSSDVVLKRFWEIERRISQTLILSAAESYVVKHFYNYHSCTDDGRFVVPLPMKPEAGVLGESRSIAVRRFISLQHSLCHKGIFHEFSSVIKEYVHIGHAEEVPQSALNKPHSVFYLSMHAVKKESSTTTKL